MTARIRIGDMLVASGVLSASHLEQALALQKRLGTRLGEILVEQGFVTEQQLTQTLSNQLSVPWVSLYHVDFTRALLNYVPRELAERWCLVPVYVRAVRREGDTLFIAMDDPTNEEAIQAVAMTAALPVKPMVAAPSDIRNVIRVYYGAGQGSAPRAAGPAYSAPRTSLPNPPAARAPAPAAAPVARPQAQPPASRQTTPTAAAQAAPPAAAPEIARAAVAAAEVTREGVAAVEVAREVVAAAPVADPEVTVTYAPARASKKPRMISITLLDGTSVSLPAPGQRRVVDAGPEIDGAEDTLTATDLVAALRAKAAGADVTDVLGNATWESMFAALLSVLLKKHLIADWEFVEEWKKHQR